MIPSERILISLFLSATPSSQSLRLEGISELTLGRALFKGPQPSNVHYFETTEKQSQCQACQAMREGPRTMLKATAKSLIVFLCKKPSFLQ